MDDVGIKDRTTLGVDTLFPVEHKMKLPDFLRGVQFYDNSPTDVTTKKHFIKYCKELQDGHVGEIISSLIFFN